MGIQVPLLTIAESGLGMSACSRTRRVTHLTLDEARVERKVKCGSPMLIGRRSDVVRRSSEVVPRRSEVVWRRSEVVRSPGWIPGYHEEIRNGPESKNAYMESGSRVPEFSGMSSGSFRSSGGDTLRGDTWPKWYCSYTIHGLL